MINPSVTRADEVLDKASDDTNGTIRVSLEGAFPDDDSTQPLPADRTSGALQVIDFAHHEIHAGDAFTACHQASSKNDGATIAIGFKTPNTTDRIHVLSMWTSSGASWFYILESATVTVNTGTSKVVYNRRRDSATASKVIDTKSSTASKVTLDPTITVNGTELWREYAGVAKQEGAKQRNSEEWILKPNMQYVFVVESDAAALVLCLNLFWYEHVDAA